MFHKIAQVCQTIFIILIVIYALISIWFPSARAETLIGKPRVIDGDTIEISGEKIRLLCIDTPESEYKGKTQYCLDNETNCGKLAKEALLEYVHNKKLRCEYEKRDIYGRILAMCQEYSWNYYYDYQGTINYYMIRNGYAWYYPSGKQCKPFKEAQEKAEELNLGLWDLTLGGFKEPKLWRKTRSND